MVKQKLRGSNNTNKLSPQEQTWELQFKNYSSNNTNKLSPQEPAIPILPVPQ